MKPDFFASASLRALCVGLLVLGLAGCNLKINMSKTTSLANVSIALDTPTAGGLPKLMNLTWTTSGTNASSVSTYTVLIKPSSADAYQTVSGVTLSSTNTSATVALTSLYNINWAQALVKVQGCDSSSVCVDSTEQKLSTVLGNVTGYFKASNTTAGAAYGMSVAISADGSTMAVGAPYEASATTTINGSQSDVSAPGAGAVYVYTRVNNSWSFTAYVKAANAGSGDHFGTAVALSKDGSMLAVGAPGESSGSVTNAADNSAAGAGAAYVFVRSSAAWSQQVYVKASNPGAGDAFGGAVALSGDGTTLAVGATGESSSAIGIGGSQTDNASRHAGAVYVYTHNSSVWSQQAYVKASFHQTATTLYGDWFGQSLALSTDGNTLAVGAGGETTGSGLTLGTGYVFIYTRSGTSWAQDTFLQAGSPLSGAAFGASLALSGDGNTLAVGAPSENNNTGAVYPFTRSSGTWSALTSLRATNAATGSAYGTSVALASGGTSLVVGAPGESSSFVGVGTVQTDIGASKSGAGYVYALSGSSWNLKTYVKMPLYSRSALNFGASLSLSNEGSLAVGATGESSAATGIGGDQSNVAASGAGAVFLY